MKASAPREPRAGLVRPPAGAGDTDTRINQALPGPRLARVILRVALLSYLFITALNVISTGLSPAADVGAILALVAVFLIQLRHSAPGPDGAPDASGS